MYHILDSRILLLLMVIVEVVLIQVNSITPPKKIILTDTGMMWGLVNIRISAQHPPCRFLLVGIILLVLLVVLHLVLVMEMVKFVWFLIPCTLPPKQFIFVLMVVILCHIRVGNIHSFVVHTNTGHIILHVLGGRIIMFLVVMVEVLLILEPTTDTPKKIILEETGMIWGLVQLVLNAQNLFLQWPLRPSSTIVSPSVLVNHDITFTTV